MSTFTITRPGPPAGKGRPRFTHVRGQVRTYTDAKTRSVESEWGWLATQAYRSTPHTGPVRLAIVAGMPIPASWSKAKRQRAIEGDEYPTTKPDADNIAKAVLDGLNGIVYDDDRRVVSLSCVKLYAERPCTQATLTLMEES